jgi:Arc/MetJ family transcription regulator
VPKTLIDIDEELLAKAQRILGTGTKKATVNAALGEVVRRDAARQVLAQVAAQVFHPATRSGPAW